MDCIVPGVAKSQTYLSDFHFHFTPIVIPLHKATFLSLKNFYVILSLKESSLSLLILQATSFLLIIASTKYTFTAFYIAS